jgi:hypothetical protein
MLKALKIIIKINFFFHKAVTFVMNGYAFILSPYDYVFVFNSICYSGFSSSSSSLWILGDVFLGAYYSIYDKANVQLGLALSLGSSSSITNSNFTYSSGHRLRTTSFGSGYSVRDFFANLLIKSVSLSSLVFFYIFY